MNKKLVFALGLLCAFSLAQVALAQTGKKKSTGARGKSTSVKTTPAPEEKPAESQLVRLTKEFVVAYGNVTELRDKATVLNYMSPTVTSDLTNANINGRIRYMDSNFDGFEAHLDRLVGATELRLNYRLKTMLHDYQSENVGITVYTAEYQMERDGSVWEKGNETVMLTYKRIDGNWKIVHYATVTIEDEKLRGECFCELFESRPGNYVTKTVVPTGRNYDALLHSFEFLTRGDTRIIKADTYQFRWLNDTHEIYAEDNAPRASSVASQNPLGTLLGTAKEKEEAILLIIKEFFYREACNTIKVRKR
ncbi:MAG: hypothetical protein MUC97_17255 [Bernardetiaceae bacterium]|jgi:hypothetical protein|nr:hypothetical protein [Bernardetiaceae bacterium]